MNHSRIAFLRRILVWPLVAVVLCSSLPAKTRAISIEDLEAQIKQRQEEIAKLEEQVAVYKKRLNQTTAEKNTLANQIYIMETQINKLQLQTQITQEQIVTTILSIEDLQIKIQQQQIDIDKNKSNLTIAIRAINEYDQQSPIEMMLGNENFSDFLNQAQYVNTLQNGIRQRVDKLKELKQQMQDQKVEKEKYHLDLEGLKKDLQNSQSALSGQVNQKEGLLKQTKGEEKRYQSILQDLINKKSAFANEIRALEQQILAAKNFLLYVQGDIPPPGTKIFIWPEEDTVLTQGYGMTSFAKQGAYGGSPHNGIDMSSGYGSKIKAIGPGTILVKGYNRGWGNWVAVKHPNNLVSLYAHMMSSSPLAIGTEVDMGTVIGFEGSTGFSTGSHLHLSIYYEFFTYQKNGELYFNYFQGTLNPLSYL